MSAQFRSLAEILREARPEEARAMAPPISPLIAEAPDPQPICEDRLFAARLCERVDFALERLLEEIATEVLGRELLLAPAELDAIVKRLLQRYGVDRATIASCGDDLTIACADGEIEASLGRRLRAALDRTLQ